MQVIAEKGTHLWKAAPGAGCPCALPELMATLELKIFMEVEKLTEWETLLYGSFFKVSWNINPGWIILVARDEVIVRDKGEIDMVVQEEIPKDNPLFVRLEIDGSSGDANLEAEIAWRLEKVFNLFKQKQASYGPGNIAEFGEKGVIIRMNDKMERLIRLVYDEEPNPLADETIEDTYLDMADYAVIAMVCRSGEWPGQK